MKVKFYIGLVFASITSMANAVGSLDDLKSVCDFPASAREARVINATAMLVPSGLIHFSGPTNTYNIDTIAFTQLSPPDGPFVCDGSRFKGETSVVSGRTGVLIAPDMILTAPHANFNPFGFVIVFRDSLFTGGAIGCENFKWNDIPASNVYFPVEALVNTRDNSQKYDYAVFRIDRQVTNRRPVKIRRSGSPRMNDLMVSIGYPERTAEKIDTAVIYRGISSVSSGGASVEYPGNYVFANLNSFEGNSGSPIYNISDEVIEAVVSYGSGAGFETRHGATCVEARHYDLQVDTNGRITDVASQIPRSEVLVTPMDHVVHVASLGAPTNRPVSSYHVSPVSSAGGGLIMLSAITGPVGSSATTPAVSLSRAPGLFTLPAEGLSFDFNANTSSITQCGAWDYQVNVVDVAHDENNFIRHRFEIGLVEVSVTPADDWIYSDIGSPYLGKRTYTIKNVRPTATSISVYAGGDLPSNVVTINGGGPTTVNLGPAGSPSDTASFEIGISAAADSVATPGVTYNLFVAFAHQNYSCSAQPVPLRYIRFKRGERLSYSQQGATLLAPPQGTQTLGAPARFDVDLSVLGGYCVSDLSLDIGFPSPGTGPADEAPRVQVKLTSPAGKSGVLWDRNISPGGSYHIVDTVESESIPFLHLDDQGTPPLGPTMLAYFNNEHINGHWYIDVRGASGLNVVGPMRVSMKAGICSP